MIEKAALPLAILLAIVFLISGIAKLLDTAAFGAFVQSLALGPVASFLAPVIPVFEICLALALLAPGTRRQAAMTAIVSLVIFTLLFFYGRIFGFAQTCECFGSLSRGGDGPVGLVIRNLVLLGFAFAAWKGSPAVEWSLSWGFAGFTFVAIVAALLSVRSYYDPFIKNTALKIGADITQTSIASNLDGSGNYTLYFYSTGCDSCLNAIANVKEYQREGTWGQVLAFTIGDAESYQPLKERLDFDVETHFLDIPDFLSYVKNIPTLYIVRDNKVVHVETGTIMAPFNMAKKIKPLS